MAFSDVNNPCFVKQSVCVCVCVCVCILYNNLDWCMTVLVWAHR